MKLSICVPNHNGGKHVIRTVKSANYLKNSEILVVDDFSTDGSSDEIKKRFPRTKIIKTKEQKWVAYVRNLCIKKSRGDLVLFLDNDVFLTKGAVEKMICEIKDTDIVFPKIDFENGVRMYPRTPEEEKYPRITAAFMIKRKSLEKLDELFDETYQFYLEDIDFFTRCRLFGLKSKYVSDALTIHVLKDAVKDQPQKFYFHVRNKIYYYLKFGPNGIMSLSELLVSLSKNFFINFLLNYSERLRYQQTASRGILDKIKLLFKHEKMIKGNRSILCKNFFSAIFWNFKNLNRTLKKRKQVFEHQKN